MKQSQKNLDQVTLVDEHDNVLGAMDKLEAHRGEGILHRAISVFLFRKRNEVIELLIQQRSDQKIVGAGQWANTVCGNVRPTEDYLGCAKRRLREELGIADSALKLTPAAKFQYQAECNEEFSENELDQVFVGWFGGKLQLNPVEVASTAWISWQDLQGSNFVKTQYDWAPWFVIMLERKEVAETISECLYAS